MGYLIPEFVSHAGCVASDWIECHDRLAVDGREACYHERNQHDWWELNRKIRKEFLRVEEVIKAQLRSGDRPSVRLVSWTQLASGLKCDRATLKHPKRCQWVDAERQRLLCLMSEIKVADSIASKKSDAVAKMGEMQRSLDSQRSQTSLWYAEYLRVKSEVDQLKRVLARRKE